MADAHMVEQVIKYSDGTETVIKYRGVIVDGVLTPDVIDNEKPMDENKEIPVVAVPEETEAEAEVVSESETVVEPETV